MVCSHCGADSPKNKNFCVECGKEIKKNKLVGYSTKINDPAFKKYIKDCGFVNQYYIETRYPADNSLIVSDYEAKECIKISEEIYEDLRGVILDK